MIVVVVSVVNNVGMAIKAAGEVGEEAKDVEDDPIMVVEVKDAEEVVDVVALGMDEEEKVEDDRDLRDGATITEEVVVVVEWEEDEDMEAGTMVRYWNCAIP